MNVKKFAYISLTVIALLVLFGSCHERGCTDPKAINYNITADEEDGSCIYCNENLSTMDTMNVNLKDDNFGSPHFNQVIARFFIHQQLVTPNDMWCGNEKCTISLTVYSLVQEDMYLPYNLFRVSGPLFFNINDNVLIEAGDTMDLGIALTFTNPPFIPIGLDSMAGDVNGTVIYY